MMNENLTACLAKQFCDRLWDSYTKKYPEFVNRISPIFVHLAVYQHLVGHRSVTGSKGRQHQQALVESFEQWYDGIEHSRDIDWIDLNLAVIDTIQGNTGDYSYGFDTSGSFFRGGDRAHDWESSINHQLFQALPTVTSLVDDNNHNQEIVRQIENLLLDFVPFPITTEILGERELLSLMVNDISRLLIGFPHDACKAQALNSYLYLFQNAALGNLKTKHECTQLALLIHERVKSIQNEGSEPRPIDSLWHMGFGYSDGLVRGYNQLVSLLDASIWSLNYSVVPSGFDVSVWSYPHKEDCQSQVLLHEVAGEISFQLTLPDKEIEMFSNPSDVVLRLERKLRTGNFNK